MTCSMSIEQNVRREYVSTPIYVASNNISGFQVCSQALYSILPYLNIRLGQSENEKLHAKNRFRYTMIRDMTSHKPYFSMKQLHVVEGQLKASRSQSGDMGSNPAGY